MPVYEYECDACHEPFEQEQKIEDRDAPCNTPCPFCGELAVLRGIGSVGFILKGSCWSRDNYARNLGDDPRYQNGTRDPRRNGG